MVADEHEASATDVSCCGIDDGESEAHGYGCVDRVAALLEDFYACIGGVVVDADDHGVLGSHRLVGGFLGEGGDLVEESGEESGQDDESGGGRSLHFDYLGRLPQVFGEFGKYL